MLKRHTKAEYFTAALLSVLIAVSAVSPLMKKFQASEEDTTGVFAPKADVRITSPEKNTYGNTEGSVPSEISLYRFENIESHKRLSDISHKFVLPLILIIIGYILSADGKKRVPLSL